MVIFKLIHYSKSTRFGVWGKYFKVVVFFPKLQGVKTLSVMVQRAKFDYENELGNGVCYTYCHLCIYIICNMYTYYH